MSTATLPAWTTRWFDVLKKAYPGGVVAKGPSPFLVIDTICECYGVESKALFAHLRHEPLATARALAMVLVANHFGFTTVETGELFARDPGCITHARRRVSDLWLSSPPDREQFARVCKKVGIDTAAISHPRGIRGHCRTRGKALTVNIRDLDPLDADLILTVIAAMTNPLQADLRTKIRQGKIALASDGTEATWVTPAS